MGVGTGKGQLPVEVLALLFIVGSRNLKRIHGISLQQGLPRRREQLKIARTVVHHAHVDQFRNLAHQLVALVIQAVGRIYSFHIGRGNLLVDLAQIFQIGVNLCDALVDVVVHLALNVGQRVVRVPQEFGEIVGLGQQILAGGLIFRLAGQLAP